MSRPGILLLFYEFGRGVRFRCAADKRWRHHQNETQPYADNTFDRAQPPGKDAIKLAVVSAAETLVLPAENPKPKSRVFTNGVCSRRLLRTKSA
jgi:hypothetical protein